MSITNIKMPARPQPTAPGNKIWRCCIFLGTTCRLVWRSNRSLVCMCTGSLVLGILFLMIAIRPRYQDPLTRLYSTKLGYGNISRKLGAPFPVQSQKAAMRVISSRLQGEGLLATEPIQVPIVAMARIVKVHTRVGDRVAKGKLLIELDSRMEQVKHDAAASAVTTALSEKERIILGSSYIAANERPERERIRNDTAQKMYKNQVELNDINHAVGPGMSRATLLTSEANLLTAAFNLKDSEWALKVATAGLKESLVIAECKINEAKLALRYRQLELENFRVYSPCDGVVERCVIHDGEYNQDPGKPAILLDMGLWFEARMDQTTAGQVALGDTAMVYLTSSPNQPLPGRVTLLGPSVSYDAGGPEATRPIRPIGSGAPEWPSTYFIRIQLDSTTLPLIPGLTGFARIESKREVLAVPISALFARSGRSALVYLVDGNRYRPCQVVVGFTTEGWAEIRSGLPVGAEVLTEGHQILQPGDKITVTRREGQVVPLAVLDDGESLLLNK